MPFNRNLVGCKSIALLLVFSMLWVNDVTVEAQQTSSDEAPANPRANPPSEAEVMAALQAGPRALSMAFRMAAKRATPSVALLYVYGQNSETQQEQQETDLDKPLLPINPEQAPAAPANEAPLSGIGSGVLISTDGLILTNNHVINNASRVVVQLADETRLDAKVIHGDSQSDVAIVRVESETDLPAMELGDSDQLEIGDWVLAIGSPFRLEATVSAGIISGKNRRMKRIPRSNMLQTDAAINPGNSGGALIDLDGKVVGISTAIASQNGFFQGVGFAIPINQAIWIARELDQHGEVRRAGIGTTLAELNPRIAAKFKLTPYSGILVYQVVKDSVAEKAGIQPLDVIVEFAGEPVRDSAALQEAIERKPIGSKQEIVIRRKGKTLTLNVQLATVDDPTGKNRSSDNAETEATDESRE